MPASGAAEQHCKTSDTVAYQHGESLADGQLAQSLQWKQFGTAAIQRLLVMLQMFVLVAPAGARLRMRTLAGLNALAVPLTKASAS